MTLDLRVLSGSRAGTREKFDEPIVSVGRHAASDFRFDPQIELDVSTRHAEFRQANGVWTITDMGSTNGTLVNGERITDAHRLHDGDIVSFGASGPRVEVRGVGATTPPTSFQKAAQPRMDTSARVAVAVKEQTKSIRQSFAIAVGVLVAAGAVGFYFWQRQTSAHERDLLAVIARQETTFMADQQKNAAARPGDTAYASALKAQLSAQQKELASARAKIAQGTASKGTVEMFSQKGADFSTVTRLNDAAVAMVVSDLDGTNTAGTAFGVTASGMLVTNKHVVHTEAGQPARRIAVILANTKGWVPAHIVRVSADDDLALIQLDRPGTIPIVAGVSRDGALARVGAQVASIGYPLAIDTPMEGTGLSDITARTTMTPGTVSKRLDNVLQMDSWSGHGASGSPVFDPQGIVIGVIYGGARESGGRIVYAVPAQRIAAFLGADGGSILR
ncbi:MAG: FHA domain-containing protein [bacterium]